MTLNVIEFKNPEAYKGNLTPLTSDFAVTITSVNAFYRNCGVEGQGYIGSKCFANINLKNVAFFRFRC